LIALRAFGSIGLYSFVAIRRRQRGQITTGCFGRGPMTSSPLTTLGAARMRSILNQRA
jgi:hypothetical protein